MTGDRFTFGDRFEIDLIDHSLVGLEDSIGHGNSELALGLQDCQPQSALQDDLVLSRPECPHGVACVSGRKNVGDGAGHLRTIPRHKGSVEASPSDRSRMVNIA